MQRFRQGFAVIPVGYGWCFAVVKHLNSNGTVILSALGCWAQLYDAGETGGYGRGQLHLGLGHDL